MTTSETAATMPVMPQQGTEPDPFLSPKRGGTELFIIRHADALPGAEEVVTGGYDEQALSELGRKQAEALAARLRVVPLAAIYASPIGRAAQTAQPTAAAHRLDIQLRPELREVELGPVSADPLSGANPEELSAALRERLREIAAIALRTGMWDSIPGTEPSDLLRARIVAAMDAIIVAHPGQRVAVVTHAGAINAYLAAVLGIPRDYFFPTMNTSISVVRALGERRLLLTLNDIGHLYAAGLLNPSEG